MVRLQRNVPVSQLQGEVACVSPLGLSSSKLRLKQTPQAFELTSMRTNNTPSGVFVCSAEDYSPFLYGVSSRT